MQENESPKEQAQNLKTGDIILINAHGPLTVDRVERVAKSVAVSIYFSNGFRHITVKTKWYKVIGFDRVYADLKAKIASGESPAITEAVQAVADQFSRAPGGIAYISPDFDDSMELITPNAKLVGKFSALCLKVSQAAPGWALTRAQIDLAHWIWQHKDSVRFDGE